jgi:uncharacterized membrane protein YeaQ/YmgE (transglycosylase-associated protein family)
MLWLKDGENLRRVLLPPQSAEHDYRRVRHLVINKGAGHERWDVPGRAAGVIANMLIPGRRSRGFGVTCVIGAAGVLLGGWAATKLFLTVIAGVIVLPACHRLTGRPGQRAYR